MDDRSAGFFVLLVSFSVTIGEASGVQVGIDSRHDIEDTGRGLGGRDNIGESHNAQSES